MKNVKTIALALSTVLISTLAVANTITIVADPWPPYNNEPGDALPGFMIEAAQMILGAEGYTVEYVTMDDWDEAIDAAREGQYDAIVGAARDDAPDFVFPDEEMGNMLNLFYVRSGDSWRYAGLGSLEGRSVAILSGYTYEEEFDEWASDHAVSFTTLEEAVEALFAGEVDTVVETEYVMMLFAMNAHIVDQVDVAGRLYDEPESVYVAFSPANPNAAAYAALLTEGMKAMKADGTWSQLLSKYGIQ